MLSFRPVAMDLEPAASLETAFRNEVGVLYDGLEVDGADMPTASPAELGPPGGAFLVGFDERNRPVCCGGVKRLDDDACEIKRMYVVPEARGAGHAGELLRALEDAARDLGFRIARLDTGPRQPHAERLYRDAGYEPIDNFNANPMASFFGEKAL